MKNILLLLVCFVMMLKSTAQGDSRHERLYIQKTKWLIVYVNAKHELIVLLRATNKKILSINLADYDAGEYLTDTSYGRPYGLSDFNFDGNEDIYFRSTSGNVMRFSSVYLFNPSAKKFNYSNGLSSMACIEADKKTRIISSYCNHTSAAENWVEKYKWQKGKLLLIEKEGTMPCPPNEDCYYTYKQKLINGRLKYIYRHKNKI